MPLKAGDPAPEINLKDQTGKIRKSKDLGRKNLVLFFYPKDNTPGCTAEACSFRDNIQSFKGLNAEVWGISGDNELSHKDFSERNNLPFPLLVDVNNNLRKAFGVKNVLGIVPGRVTFIINNTGIIINVFSDLLNGPAHVEESIKTLESLKG